MWVWPGVRPVSAFLIHTPALLGERGTRSRNKLSPALISHYIHPSFQLLLTLPSSAENSDGGRASVEPENDPSPFTDSLVASTIRTPSFARSGKVRRSFHAAQLPAETASSSAVSSARARISSPFCQCSSNLLLCRRRSRRATAAQLPRPRRRPFMKRCPFVGATQNPAPSRFHPPPNPPLRALRTRWSAAQMRRLKSGTNSRGVDLSRRRRCNSTVPPARRFVFAILLTSESERVCRCLPFLLYQQGKGAERRRRRRRQRRRRQPSPERWNDRVARENLLNENRR